MNRGGFGNYSSGSPTYANRDGPFSSNYSRGNVDYRGGGVAGNRGYGSVGGAGFGFSYNGGINSSASSFAAGFRGSNFCNSVDGSNRGNGTARVAVIGTTQAAFVNWWAIHAAGFQVSVVVGVDDLKESSSANDAAATTVIRDEEWKASAETARAFAVRCTQFYRLPRRTTLWASSPSSASSSPASTSEIVPTAGATVPTSEKAGVSPSLGKTDTKDVVEVCVQVSDVPMCDPATTTTNPITAPTAIDSKRESVTQPCITATAWSYFLKPFFDAQNSHVEEKSGNPVANSSRFGTKGAHVTYWSNRSATQDKTSETTGTTPPLVESVEVIYVASLQNHSVSGNVEGEKERDNEAVGRAALVWLIGKGKHLVVDCVLSSETVAACAAAATTVTHGKAEMQRVFLYRGGGVRYGWSPAAMTQLRKALAIRRGTGQASEKINTTAAKSEGSAPATPAKSALAGDPTTTLASEADHAFSVFDFMDDGGGNPFDGAVEGTEKNSTTTDRKTAATPVEVSKKDEEESTRDEASGMQTDDKAEAKAVQRIVTSIALESENGVAGALRELRFTVRGSKLGRGDSSSGDVDEAPCSSALGVMDTLGWDAVAWVLHLLDWTCPDMVQGRVVRRSKATQAPLCVEAELYYGIDGTADEEEDEDVKEEGDTSKSGGVNVNFKPQWLARPRYLRVLLHISSHAGDTRSSVFQQCMRAVGTKAVVTVTHPLLPPPSETSIAASTVLSTSPLTASSSSIPPSFRVTTARATGFGAAASTAAKDVEAKSLSAAPTAPPLPAMPGVSYTYVIATQDAPPGSFQRMRKEKPITILTPTTASATAGEEPCAEVRLWQHVRSQLYVTTSTVNPSSSSVGFAGVGMGGGYQPYGSRYATRGRYGTNIGLGRGHYGRGRGGVSGAAAPATPQTVKAELSAAETAAVDVQRAWLVQRVVECILSSAVS